MKKTCHSTFSTVNVKRRSEPAATFTVYCDTSAMHDVSKCSQEFVGTKIILCDVHGVKYDKQFFNSLEDNIRQKGAMDKLTSDSAQSENRTRFKDILRALFIDDWQCSSNIGLLLFLVNGEH